MQDKKVLYLSQADVVSAGVEMAEIIKLLETAFKEKGEGRVEMPPKPGIHPGEGAFASLVDFDSYWHADAFREVDKFCTDDVPQLEHYREVGYFQPIPPIHADLGELVVGKKPGRQSAVERTMTCNLGLAMDDMAVAPTLYQRAIKMNLGTWLPL